MESGSGGGFVVQKELRAMTVIEWEGILWVLARRGRKGYEYGGMVGSSEPQHFFRTCRGAPFVCENGPDVWATWGGLGSPWIQSRMDAEG